VKINIKLISTKPQRLSRVV